MTTDSGPDCDPDVATQVCVRSIHSMAEGTYEEFEQIVHPEAINREAGDEPPECRVPGPAGFYATALWLRAPIEGLGFEVHESVAQDDLVAVRVTMSGRQVGPMVVYGPDGSVAEAFPPRGRTFATTQSHWFRVREGLVVEHWANRDDLGTAKQLGWVPPSPVYLARMALARRRARSAASA